MGSVITDSNANIRRRAQLKAYALIAPLALLLLLTFAIPLGFILTRSVSDPELVETLPNLSEALAAWDGKSAPPSSLLDAARADLDQVEPQKLAAVARRLSYEGSGFRSLLTSTKRKVKTDPATAFNDPLWQNRETWQAMKRAVGPVTDYFLLAAIDKKRDYQTGLQDGSNRGLYTGIMARTFVMAIVVTVACLFLAFPLCSYLARQSDRLRNILLLFVLLPFWTAALVRNTAWMIILQDRGAINQVLLSLGIIEAPLSLMYNRGAVIVAMAHVMLPFMIFPLLASMRSVDQRLLMAASSLGAGPAMTFLKVYLPQIMPGVMAGSLMVFIVTLGFYITPALLGGPADQMISYYIAQFTTATQNWGMAAALSVILLLATGLLYLLQTSLSRRFRGGAR
jgi:putative spermidine/putrescine transport system permease protein